MPDEKELLAKAANALDATMAIKQPKLQKTNNLKDMTELPDDRNKTAQRPNKKE